MKLLISLSAESKKSDALAILKELAAKYSISDIKPVDIATAFPRLLKVRSKINPKTGKLWSTYYLYSFKSGRKSYLVGSVGGSVGIGIYNSRLADVVPKPETKTAFKRELVKLLSPAE